MFEIISVRSIFLDSENGFYLDNIKVAYGSTNFLIGLAYIIYYYLLIFVWVIELDRRKSKKAYVHRNFLRGDSNDLCGNGLIRKICSQST